MNKIIVKFVDHALQWNVYRLGYSRMHGWKTFRECWCGKAYFVDNIVQYKVYSILYYVNDTTLSYLVGDMNHVVENKKR